MASRPVPGKRLRERLKTDQSLRLERSKADRELDRRAARTAEDAVNVVRAAREQAARVVAGARRRADAGTPAAKLDQKIRRARSRADAQLRQEYSSADTQMVRQRTRRARALAQLFLAERELTDERLQTERTRGDRLVSARDELLAQVSHDLRGFLATIAMRAELLDRLTPQNSELPVAQAVLAIKEATALMGRLIADLLDAASMEAGTFRILRDDTQLARLLNDTAGIFREAAARKNISLTVTTAACRPRRFDHQRVVQVLANLVGNAIKFTPPGGTIAIRLESDGGECRVSVADSGSGIPKHKLAKIFERFNQERRSSGAGLGLGLFIARSIAERHGGKAWAESTLGRGSTFHFTLPSAAR